MASVVVQVPIAIGFQSTVTHIIQKILTCGKFLTHYDKFFVSRYTHKVHIQLDCYYYKQICV